MTSPTSCTAVEDEKSKKKKGERGEKKRGRRKEGGIFPCIIYLPQPREKKENTRGGKGGEKRRGGCMVIFITSVCFLGLRLERGRGLSSFFLFLKQCRGRVGRQEGGEKRDPHARENRLCYFTPSC